MEEFDQSPWDPSPIQYAFTGLTVSWVISLFVESFLLHQDDCLSCLKRLVGFGLSGQFNGDFWNPLVLWFILPLVVFYIPIKLFKPYRKQLLGIGTLVLSVLLIVMDLRLRVF